MKGIFGIIAFFLCVNFTFSAKNTYKAAVVLEKAVNTAKYISYINNAATSNVDVLVVPSPDYVSVKGAHQYDEVMKMLSNAAKQNRLYVITHLLEKTKCQKVDVMVRNSLVFGRDGAVVCSYRKPVHSLTNCTTSDPDVQTFTTDFGVTFGLLMEEDLVLQNVELTKNLKNFIVVGDFATEIPFLSASRFSPSWAYVTDANLIASAGVYFGKSGKVGVCSNNKIIVAELDKDGRSDNQITPPAVSPSKVHIFPGEDLSQYIIRPLNLETSTRGYKETVCHRGFCCDFDVKTRFSGSQHNDLSYGLAVFNGVRRLWATHHIGAQTCAVIACAGLYKRSCSIGSSNDTNVHFHRLSVSAKFTKFPSAQFPILVSADASKFKFDIQTVKKYRKVSFEVENSQIIWSFGIFGRDYASDFEENYVHENINSKGLTSDIYEYFNSEDVVEFFDYLWIRLKIVIFVVSIYFLEMM